tara:strand:+ start:6466 stop:7644 length:1179 start_codon:yes stop_codon:yes gene_type:complete
MKILLNLSVITVLFITTSCLKEEDIDPISTPTNSYNFLYQENNCNVISGEINEDFTINSDQCWKIRGNTYVNSGVILTIESGATITAESYSSPTYLSIRQGGKIIAQGTSDQPIRFTHEDLITESWSGIHINGFAQTNKNNGYASGYENTGDYGGNNNEDNSGILKYIIIEYAGQELEPGKKSNGLQLNGVGSNTLVDYVQIYNCKNDGLKINGGSVDVNHLVVTHIDQDCVDLEYGWIGTGSYWYIEQIEEIGSDEAIQIDNNETFPEAIPRTNLNLSNITVNGFGEESAVRVRSGARVDIQNLLIDNFDLGIEITGSHCNLSVMDYSVTFSNVSINNCSQNIQYTPSVAEPSGSLNGNDQIIAQWTANSTSNGCEAIYGSGWMNNWVKQF